MAQSPEKFSYQAVIRDSLGNIVKNSSVGMKISILQGSATGTTVYTELFNPNPKTNANGLVTLEIGSGIPVSGTFSSIDWASGAYFVKTEIDPTGSTNYSVVGTSQRLSAPYAMYAKKSGGEKVAFRATGISPPMPITGVFNFAIFDKEEFDYGNNFSDSVFTDTSDGLYHFDANTLIRVRFTELSYMYVSIYKNQNAAISNYYEGTAPDFSTCALSTTLFLTKGDKIKLCFSQGFGTFDVGSDVNASNRDAMSSFSGYKLP